MPEYVGSPEAHLRSLPVRLSDSCLLSSKMYLPILIVSLPALPIAMVEKENLTHSWVNRTRFPPLSLPKVLLGLPGNEVNVAFWVRNTRFAATGSSKRSVPECLDGRRIQGSHLGAITMSQPDSLMNKDLLDSLDNRVKPCF
jgi:hypothetical protein